MFISTRYPAFPVRDVSFRFGARSPFPRTAFVRPAGPAVSGRWVDDAYELTADLPGVPDDAVVVAIAGRTLTIDVATDALTWSERVRLPQTLDPEQVAARYLNGRLTVTIGKTAEAAPRSIAIDTAPRPELVAADVQSEGSETSATG